jgi:hypothetical protein
MAEGRFCLPLSTVGVMVPDDGDGAAGVGSELEAVGRGNSSDSIDGDDKGERGGVDNE